MWVVSIAFQLWMLRGRDGTSVKPLRAPGDSVGSRIGSGRGHGGPASFGSRLANSRVPNIHLKW